MKATNSRIKISSVTPFRPLMSFDESNAEIKSDYDFTKNWSENRYVEDKKNRGQTTKTVSLIHTLQAQQMEIKKLRKQVEKFQYENSILVKWINFLY